MPPTTYELTYRASSKVLLWTMIAEFIIAIIGLWTTDYLKYLHPWYWYRFKIYYDGCIIFGPLFLFLYATRTRCQLELNDAGFTIYNFRRFKLLRYGEQFFPWSAFLYQAGGLNSSKYRSYRFAIFLNDGRSFEFLTGNSPEELEIIEYLHTDMENRLREFKIGPITPP